MQHEPETMRHSDKPDQSLCWWTPAHVPCHALQELSSNADDGITSLRSPVPDILKPLIPAQVCLYSLPVINGCAQANLLPDLSCKDDITFREASVINANTGSRCWAAF